jgi:hypothetical protein
MATQDFHKKNNEKSKYFKNSASSSIKPITLVIGNELEYRVQRLMIYMGFYCRRAKPIYTVARLDQATDLDIFSLKWKEQFKRELSISECKSGSDRPLDRIFWLSGVKNFVKAQEAFLIRNSTKWNIKDFAKSCGIQVWDRQRIEELEKIYSIRNDDWPGLSDSSFFKNNLDEWNVTLKNNPNIWELFWTVSSEILFDEPFVIINYLMSQLRIISDQSRFDLKNSFFRFLVGESICQIAISTMIIAEQTFDLSGQDRIGFIKRGLKYGSLEPESAERILNSAYNLAQQTISHYTNNSLKVDKSLFEMSEPPGTEEIVDIVELIISNYPHSLKFIPFIDLFIMDQFVKVQPPKGYFKSIHSSIQNNSIFELCKGFLRKLEAAKACPNIIVETLTNRAELESPKGQVVSQEQSSMDIKTDVPQSPDLFTDEKKPML